MADTEETPPTEAPESPVSVLPRLRSASGSGGLRTLRSGSASPTRRGRKWAPQGSFDSGSSRRERCTLTYDAAKDPNLTPDFRTAIQKRVGSMTKRTSYTFERDRLNNIDHNMKHTEQTSRTRFIKEIETRRPDFMFRTWDLWPEIQAYYPSLLSAGGSELCPIERRKSINAPYEPKQRKSNESLLMTGEWRGSSPVLLDTLRSTGTHNGSLISFKLPVSPYKNVVDF